MKVNELGFIIIFCCFVNLFINDVQWQKLIIKTIKEKV